MSLHPILHLHRPRHFVILPKILVARRHQQMCRFPLFTSERRGGRNLRRRATPYIVVFVLKTVTNGCVKCENQRRSQEYGWGPSLALKWLPGHTTWLPWRYVEKWLSSTSQTLLHCFHEPSRLQLVTYKWQFSKPLGIFS